MSSPLQADLFDCAVVDLLTVFNAGEPDEIADARRYDLPELISWADGLAKRASDAHDDGLFVAYFMLATYLRGIGAGDELVPAVLINLGDAVVKARGQVAA